MLERLCNPQFSCDTLFTFCCRVIVIWWTPP